MSLTGLSTETTGSTLVNGTVFDIQKFSLHDGPGIRTTVFLKGCPLRCVWCHNPESWSGEKQLLYAAERCVNCGSCTTLCLHGCHTADNFGKHNFERSRCTMCGACTKKCYTDALSLCGKEMSVEEVLEQVLKDKIFFENSGGGMTLSGGEPMAQFPFALELIRQAKAAGVHVAMETCGFAQESQYAQLIGLVDLFLFDIKSTDPAKHKEYTGQENALILKNLRFLDAEGVNFRLRCPLIPGLNDSEDDLRGIAELANTLSGISGIDVEPYHPLGVSKAAQLGIKDFFDAPFAEKEHWASWVATLKKYTDIEVTKQ